MLKVQARANLLARAFSYPYAAPSSPVVVRSGQQVPQRSTSLMVDRSGLVIVGGVGPCLPMLAVGSNAAPSVLCRKFGTRPHAIVQGPVQVTGYQRVHSAHIARYGAVPATVVEKAGVVLDAHLQLVPLSALPLLDASEALGVNYERVRMAVSRLRAPWIAPQLCRQLTHVWTYRSLHGPLERDGDPVPLGRQRDALQHAADRVGWRLALEPFVYLAVRDAGFRSAVTSALKN